jgi:hypothetical protein
VLAISNDTPWAGRLAECMFGLDHSAEPCGDSSFHLLRWGTFVVSDSFQ